MLSLVFSLGMYIGIDRSEVAADHSMENLAKESTETNEVDVVDRDKIVEEVEAEIIVSEIEPTFLHSIASEGEKIVKVIFDRIVDVTYAVVDGIF